MKTKTKSILPFNWRTELENLEFDAIGDDIILLDKPMITSVFQYPFKIDLTVAIICIKGTTEGSINLKPRPTSGSCLVTVLPDQIMEYKSISEDFSGLFIVMSKKFTDGLMVNAAERLPLFLAVRDNPVIPLNEETLEGTIQYFNMLKRVAKVKDHPYSLEVARHLTLAFFYGVGDSLHNHRSTDDKKMTHHEILVEKFLRLVQTHHGEQRGLEFYAEKLFFTPKHLSKVIKQNTGKSASDWIDEHVAMEAKALLKSTNMTIQQISEELNFPSQSFFGKYFKRVTGISPKEYQRKN
ncbi:MAG: helix-turn-helix domain-containing protein [Bacteroidales bacterium]|nr:helix-turn-helix domain-containing protein [Bacteroidales bacterium]